MVLTIITKVMSELKQYRILFKRFESKEECESVATKLGIPCSSTQADICFYDNSSHHLFFAVKDSGMDGMSF